MEVRHGEPHAHLGRLSRQHTVSTWPHSQEVIARDFAGVPEQEKQKIVRRNVIELYGLDLAK